MKNANQIKFKSAQNKSENMCKIVNMYLKNNVGNNLLSKKCTKVCKKTKKG